MTVDIVFWTVVLARFALPLLIPQYPLPGIIACLVLDGVDQTIFQAFGFDPPGYQSYDKAMDLFYLSVAFLSSLQNWTRAPAVGISRFLFFYRMVGVMAFELTGVRRCCWSSRTPSSTSSSPTRGCGCAGTRAASAVRFWVVARRRSGSSSSCRRSTGSTSPSWTSPTRSGTSRGSCRPRGRRTRAARDHLVRHPSPAPARRLAVAAGGGPAAGRDRRGERAGRLPGRAPQGPRLERGREDLPDRADQRDLRPGPAGGRGERPPDVPRRRRVRDDQFGDRALGRPGEASRGSRPGSRSWSSS